MTAPESYWFLPEPNDPFITESNVSPDQGHYTFKVPLDRIEWIRDRFPKLNFGMLQDELDEITTLTFFKCSLEGYYTKIASGERLLNRFGYIIMTPVESNVEDVLTEFYKIKKWGGDLSDSESFQHFLKIRFMFLVN